MCISQLNCVKYVQSGGEAQKKRPPPTQGSGRIASEQSSAQLKKGRFPAANPAAAKRHAP